MSSVVYLSDVILSFSQVIFPQETTDRDGNKKFRYGADFIMPPDHKGFAEFMKVVNELALSNWREKATTIMNMINNDQKLRNYGDGNNKINKTSGEIYTGYVGMKYITAFGSNIKGSNTNRPPELYNANGSKVNRENAMELQAIADKLYGGCHVNVALKPWLQNSVEWGKGVRCDLLGVQFLKDGTPFGEAIPDVSSLFGAVPEQPRTSMPETPSFLN